MGKVYLINGYADNDGTYEDYWSGESIIKAFSTKEKAVNYLSNDLDKLALDIAKDFTGTGYEQSTDVTYVLYTVDHAYDNESNSITITLTAVGIRNEEVREVLPRWLDVCRYECSIKEMEVCD